MKNERHQPTNKLDTSNPPSCSNENWIDVYDRLPDDCKRIWAYDGDETWMGDCPYGHIGVFRVVNDNTEFDGYCTDSYSSANQFNPSWFDNKGDWFQRPPSNLKVRFWKYVEKPTFNEKSNIGDSSFNANSNSRKINQYDIDKTEINEKIDSNKKSQDWIYSTLMEEINLLKNPQLTDLNGKVIRKGYVFEGVREHKFKKAIDMVHERMERIERHISNLLKDIKPLMN